MDLTFETGTHDRWKILAVAGELDLHTSPQLGEAITGALGERVHLVLDLRGVSFMDSSSLGVIVAGLKRAREKGGDLALMGVQGSPRKVLSLTGLDDVFRVVASLDELPEA